MFLEEKQEQLIDIIERQKRIEKKLDLLIILPAYDDVTFWKRKMLVEDEMKKVAKER